MTKVTEVLGEAKTKTSKNEMKKVASTLKPKEDMTPQKKEKITSKQEKSQSLPPEVTSSWNKKAIGQRVDSLLKQNVSLNDRLNAQAKYIEQAVEKDNLTSFIMGELLRLNKDRLPTKIKGSFEPNGEGYLMITQDVVLHDNKLYNIIESTIVK